jgi:hypothetical protein
MTPQTPTTSVVMLPMSSAKLLGCYRRVHEAQRGMTAPEGVSHDVPLGSLSPSRTAMRS